MTCESCGAHMDPFGDDSDGDTSMETMRLRSGLIRVIDGGNLARVKATCPECGHVQYGCKPTIDVDGSD
jgi:hypothetical protein